MIHIDETKLINILSQPQYRPVRLRHLARYLKIDDVSYPEFRQLVKTLIKQGKLESDAQGIRLARAKPAQMGTFRRRRSGGGTIRVLHKSGSIFDELIVPSGYELDAAHLDVVEYEYLKLAGIKLPRTGQRLARVKKVVERSVRQYVGQYSEIERIGQVQIEGTYFDRPVFVGDASAKRAEPGDMVVVEFLRYPTADQPGEVVITEILGQAGEPGIDVLTVIRQFEIPDAFPAEVLADARQVAAQWSPDDIPDDRVDLTKQFVLTIDPVDAHDFDDALSLERLPDGQIALSVHIADVAAFVPENSSLDREAKLRGTSVYLPGKVIPMLPELVSNGLASLQQDRNRLTKTVIMTFSEDGVLLDTEFKNTVINNHLRLTYGQVQDYFDGKQEEPPIPDFGKRLLGELRSLANILRERRRKDGMLELDMPEARLVLSHHGEVTGAAYAPQLESNRLIEEFMVQANEAVARLFRKVHWNVPRRIHPAPDPKRLDLLADFADSLDFGLRKPVSRTGLQRLLNETRHEPAQKAIHYAILRSLREAEYSIDLEGHFALASEDYCHFTSPIRRYPDLIVHRALDRHIKGQRGGGDPAGLKQLCEHCSKTERRAQKAERELIKIKLLQWLSTRVGDIFDLVITGVEDFGFFAQGIDVPFEGLMHIRNLDDDFYWHDETAMALVGRRAGNRYQLGHSVRLKVMRVDMIHRQVDLGWPDQPLRTDPIARRSGDSFDGRKRRRRDDDVVVDQPEEQRDKRRKTARSESEVPIRKSSKRVERRRKAKQRRKGKRR